ncbi:hypothetical protein HHI36_022351 [Cryptolaemus montrouzieri]|uniref:Orotate phosphoribosyltransferase n=1 Tax=Cryptolaemus montrouzieri TaxID=559131 RepID=A0ABD2MZM2_9CUCU
MESLAMELSKINAIKFEDYKTKVGLYNPVYFDLRESLVQLMMEMIDIKNSKLVCGVPYTALPIATIISLISILPMVMRCKEAKSYGTKELIEGIFSDGDSCLIIEDVVTSGSSILETVEDLKASGIVCSEAIVLLDREQGGKAFLAENGIKRHSILTITELMRFLFKRGFITAEIKATVNDHIACKKMKSENVTISMKEALTDQ